MVHRHKAGRTDHAVCDVSRNNPHLVLVLAMWINNTQLNQHNPLATHSDWKHICRRVEASNAYKVSHDTSTHTLRWDGMGWDGLRR